MATVENQTCQKHKKNMHFLIRLIGGVDKGTMYVLVRSKYLQVFLLNVPERATFRAVLEAGTPTYLGTGTSVLYINLTKLEAV